MWACHCAPTAAARASRVRIGGGEPSLARTITSSVSPLSAASPYCSAFRTKPISSAAYSEGSSARSAARSWWTVASIVSASGWASSGPTRNQTGETRSPSGWRVPSSGRAARAAAAAHRWRSRTHDGDPASEAPGGKPRTAPPRSRDAAHPSARWMGEPSPPPGCTSSPYRVPAGRQQFPATGSKFPAQARREFARKPLNILAKLRLKTFQRRDLGKTPCSFPARRVSAA